MSSTDTTLLVIIAIALVVQSLATVGFAVAAGISAKKAQQAIADLQAKANPILDHSRELVTDVAPMLRSAAANVLQTSVMLREKAEEIGTTVSSANVRVRSQIERVDELLAHTLSKVESTATTVEQKVLSPVRTMNGILSAIRAAMDTMKGVDRRSAPRTHAQDDNFI